MTSIFIWRQKIDDWLQKKHKKLTRSGIHRYVNRNTMSAFALLMITLLAAGSFYGATMPIEQDVEDSDPPDPPPPAEVVVTTRDGQERTLFLRDDKPVAPPAGDANARMPPVYEKAFAAYRLTRPKPAVAVALDPQTQEQARNILVRELEDDASGSRTGAAVVIDVATGDITTATGSTDGKPDTEYTSRLAVDPVELPQIIDAILARALQHPAPSDKPEQVNDDCDFQQLDASGCLMFKDNLLGQLKTNRELKDRFVCLVAKARTPVTAFTPKARPTATPSDGTCQIESRNLSLVELAAVTTMIFQGAAGQANCPHLLLPPDSAETEACRRRHDPRIDQTTASQIRKALGPAGQDGKVVVSLPGRERGLAVGFTPAECPPGHPGCDTTVVAVLIDVSTKLEPRPLERAVKAAQDTAADVARQILVS